MFVGLFYSNSTATTKERRIVDYNKLKINYFYRIYESTWIKQRFTQGHISQNRQGNCQTRYRAAGGLATQKNLSKLFLNRKILIFRCLKNSCGNSFNGHFSLSLCPVSTTLSLPTNLIILNYEQAERQIGSGHKVHH